MLKVIKAVAKVVALLGKPAKDFMYYTLKGSGIVVIFSGKAVKSVFRRK